MKSFAPMPLGALAGRTVSLSAFRLLAHLLGLRTLFGFKDEFSVTDYELLNGYRDRKSDTEFHSCGLARNTMIKARARLEELGYIKCQFLRGNTGQSRYRYTLVSGRAILYKEEKDQVLTTPSSKNDSLYIEEKRELLHPPPIEFSAPTDELGPESNRRGPFAEAASIDEMVAGISRLYTHHHPYSLTMPNSKVVKASLTKFRKDNPTWSLHRMEESLKNIYGSSPLYVNKAKSPDAWIKRLPEFSRGPLGEFGKPLDDDFNFDGDLKHLPIETSI
jgi:hypothetical protein